MLALADVSTWIEAQGVTESIFINWLPASPDAAVLIYSPGGGSPTENGAFEPSMVHIQVRAATDQAAYATASMIHRAITALAGSLTMGSTFVKSVESVGGPPAFLTRDNLQRTYYLGIYQFSCPT